MRVTLKDNPELSERLGAYWTPTLLVVDDSGRERHRFVGFLPPSEFRAELVLGLIKTCLGLARYDEAIRHTSEIGERHAATHCAPEAMYWRGVAQYRATGNVALLLAEWREIINRFPSTEWAKKVSFIPH